MKGTSICIIRADGGPGDEDDAPGSLESGVDEALGLGG